MIRDPPEHFPHSMEPQLRKLGLSTSLTKGVPTLQTPHVICKAGDKLTSEQVGIFLLLIPKSYRVTLKFDDRRNC